MVQTKFKINISDLIKNPILFEDDEYQISGNSIQRFLDFYMRNNDIENILLNENKEIVFNFYKSQPLNNIKFITKEFHKTIFEHRFPLENLMMPFFKKRNNKRNELKDYQLEGINWLLEKPSRILADDMGLGKTLQAITAARAKILKGEVGTVLIICPSSLIFNWCKEIEKWFPDMASSALYDLGKDKINFWNQLFSFNHFVITNYEQIRDIDLEKLNIKFDLIIADEAHKLRKGSSKLFKQLSVMEYKSFWALSGTPIEKNDKDVCHIMKIVDPSRNLTADLDLPNSSLRSQLRDYLLRRLKKEVLSDLIDFSEKDYFVELSGTQKLSYKMALKERENPNADKLSIFNNLREICDIDPKSNQSSKIDLILELLEKIKALDEKVVIFSFWLKPLFELQKRITKKFGKESSSVYSGELSKIERESKMQNFKNSKSNFVFLCSGKIGGEGINLTEANHAIFFNRWWNPSNNNQAKDRLIRIGQEKDVFIYNIISGETIESELKFILEGKKEINNEVIEKLVNSHGSK
tara:strand:- start:2684 stop:4258 length:1575 start_codon:yes stop_codon:yes gene_type:complete